MKKMVFIVLAILVAAITLGTVSVCFADDNDPGAIVNFTTKSGYADYCANADAWDLKSYTTGEYTIHGSNGLVDWAQITEEGETFARFTAKEPLDEKGKDAEGVNQGAGDFRMSAEIEFDPTEYDYIAFCYRATKGGHISTNQIYVRDSSHYGEFQATDGMWTTNNLKAKGEWYVRVVQISKSLKAVEGSFKSIRIPICGRVNETFDLKWIACFKTKEAAENFDINAYNLAHPEATDTPAPTDTSAPTAEPTTEPTAEPTAEPKKTGCAGTIAGAGAIAVSAGATVVLLKKKKNRE